MSGLDMDHDATAMRARNRRTGLILATVALAFFLGVILKYVLR